MKHTNEEYEQQTGRNLMRWEPKPSNYVNAGPSTSIQQLQPHQVSLDLTHPATQHVEMRTSAVDRAQGYQIMITPISLVVAVFAVLVSLAFENEFFTFWSLLLFWGTFCVVYVAGWILTAVNTPEFVSLFSAHQQWDVVKREQKERWEHYKWQSGRPQYGRPWWVEYKPVIIVVVLVWMVLVLAIVVGGL